MVSKKSESREEMIKRLTERFRKLLEERTPEEPGTLAEIEEISQNIGEKIKREIEDSFCSTHGSGYVGPKIKCSCGRLAEFKNYYNKRYVSLCGEHVLRRAYYYCKECKSGFAPVDIKLGLDSGSTSRAVRTKVARLAAWIPFERLSKELEVILNLHLSKNTCERTSEAVGERIISEQRQQEAAVFSGEVNMPKAAPDRLYIGIDGTGVPMRGGGTRESKTGIIYQTRERAGKDKVVNAEYLATLERVDSFGEQVYARAFRHGVENATDVACLGDGARWIWRSFSHHYPKAVQILDYYHACEHLATVANAWYGEDMDAVNRWQEVRQADLLSDCVESVIRSMRSWKPVDEESKKVRQQNLK